MLDLVATMVIPLFFRTEDSLNSRLIWIFKLQSVIGLYCLNFRWGRFENSGIIVKRCMHTLPCTCVSWPLDSPPLAGMHCLVWYSRRLSFLLKIVWWLVWLFSWVRSNSFSSGESVYFWGRHQLWLCSRNSCVSFGHKQSPSSDSRKCKQAGNGFEALAVVLFCLIAK